jgi:hypothetical protein
MSVIYYIDRCDECGFAEDNCQCCEMCGRYEPCRPCRCCDICGRDDCHDEFEACQF